MFRKRLPGKTKKQEKIEKALADPVSYTHLDVYKRQLLIEVGTDANTIEEATYTGELLGNVLASVLNQLQG